MSSVREARPVRNARSSLSGARRAQAALRVRATHGSAGLEAKPGLAARGWLKIGAEPQRWSVF